MAKKKKKERQQDEAQVPISSMIDVVFLLIIFFVVTAAIDKEIADEEIKLADAPHGKPMTKKDPRAVTINVRENGKLNIAGHFMSRQQISNQLKVAAQKWGNDIPIIIRGDRKTQHGYIQEVMEAVTATGLYKVRFDAVINQ